VVVIGGDNMYTVLMVIMAIVSVVLILSVLLQEGNSDGLSGSIAGGAEQLFGEKRGRGYQGILEKITVVSSILFMVLALVLVVLTGK
jgi:preprotein translocase subunit SecG